MTAQPHPHGDERAEQLCLFALGALPADEAAAVETLVRACPDCAHDLQRLRAVVATFHAWPTDVLRPPGSTWDRIAERIGADPALRSAHVEPRWQTVAPGIECKLLAVDADTRLVSMLVRLAAGAHYPPHEHASSEELFLLDGVLVNDGRQLLPGEHSFAAAGTTDRQVWSPTGCTCVLVTSANDQLQ